MTKLEDKNSEVLPWVNSQYLETDRKPETWFPACGWSCEFSVPGSPAMLA